MKKLIALAIVLLYGASIATGAFAGTEVTTPVTASADNALAIEFGPTADGWATDGSGISFDVDAAAYAAGYVDAVEHVSGKSDLAVYCYDNSGSTWYLKMHISDTAGDLGGTVGVYRYIAVGGAENKNTSTATDGTIAGAGAWTVLATSAGTIYTSNNDTVNTPLGTSIGMSFSLQDLTALQTGVSYSSTITYTVTESSS
ncbi:hypothetical protein ACFL3N_01620 [Candidatus Omnitrophota bacterium]